MLISIMGALPPYPRPRREAEGQGEKTPCPSASQGIRSARCQGQAATRCPCGAALTVQLAVRVERSFLRTKGSGFKGQHFRATDGKRTFPTAWVFSLKDNTKCDTF